MLVVDTSRVQRQKRRKINAIYIFVIDYQTWFKAGALNEFVTTHFLVGTEYFLQDKTCVKAIWRNSLADKLCFTVAAA